MRVTLIVALCALVCASAASAGLPKKGPLLTLNGDSPIMLSGSKFKANEKVIVLMTGTKASKRVVRTSADGTFRFRLPLIFRYTRCGGFMISALGAAGERAFTGMGTTCDPSLGTSHPGVKIPSAGN
jgi:hypothetical protein